MTPTFTVTEAFAAIPLAASLRLGEARANQILDVCELLHRDCLVATP
jgi:hypothetical protein